MRDYALVFLVTAAVTYLLVPLVRRIAVRTHAMHEPRARDTHVTPTPLLGGLAMYGGLVAGLLIASRLSFVQDPFRTAGSRSQTGLLLAGGLVVLVGFADDRWGLSALSRLAAQVAAAGILVWSGQALPWLPTLHSGVVSLEPDLSVTLTILIVVATMNAINFIDGLDGLAAGITAVAALSFLVYSYSLIKNIGSTSQSLPAVTSALVAGMCVGFLPHNFYPARIFMGDIGAMLLGLLLAYGPISSTNSLDPALLIAYSHNPNHPLDRFPTILPLLVPLAIFIVPYADLMFAIIRRAKAGKPLMAADRQHMHHRLLNIGHSYRQSVLLMYLWAALFSVTVVSLSLVRTPSVVFVVATLVAVLALLPATMPQLRPWHSAPPAHPAARPQPRGPGPPAHASPAPPPPAPVPPVPSVPPVPAGPAGPAPVPPAHAARAQAVPPQVSSAPFPAAQPPSASVPATATPVPDVPRFLPAEPSVGVNGTHPPVINDVASPYPADGHSWPDTYPGPRPGSGWLAGRDPFPGPSPLPGPSSFPGPSPFPGQPVSNGHQTAPWDQPPSPVPAPWSRDRSFPGHDSFPDQAPFPAQDPFRGHGPYPGESPFPGQPDPGDEALEHRPHSS
jgi:UDP-GlcNAc:undecaprenyl-phosphate GlcNAc-1-phosphate transferase